MVTVSVITQNAMSVVKVFIYFNTDRVCIMWVYKLINY